MSITTIALGILFGLALLLIVLAVIFRGAKKDWEKRDNRREDDEV